MATYLPDLLRSGLPPALARTAALLRDIQTRVAASLPAGLRDQVLVAGQREDRLNLVCNSGATASYLRNRHDTLLTALQRQGLDLTRIEIRVAPDLFQPLPAAAEKPGVPAAGLAAVSALARDIEAGPLKEALDRMVQHHRAGPD